MPPHSQQQQKRLLSATEWGEKAEYFQYRAAADKIGAREVELVFITYWRSKYVDDWNILPKEHEVYLPILLRLYGEVMPRLSRYFVFLRCTVFEYSCHVEWLTHLLTTLPNPTCVLAYLLTVDPFQIDTKRDRRREGDAHANRLLRLTTAQYYLPFTEEQHPWTQLENCKSFLCLYFATVFLFRLARSDAILIPCEWKLLVVFFRCWQER